MDFQMQVHTFFPNLTGIPFVLRDGDQELWFSADVWKESAYRVEIYPPELVRKGQMWNSMHVFTFGINNSTLNNLTHTTHAFLYEQFRPLLLVFLLKREAYVSDIAEMWIRHIFLQCFEFIKSSRKQYRHWMLQDGIGSQGYQPKKEWNENCCRWPAILLNFFNCHGDGQRSHPVSILCFS